mgnify:CR=1 FL=1
MFDNCFICLFTLVLTCDELPEIENSVVPSVGAPYLAGKTIVDYQCQENYQFKYPEYNSTKCAAIVGEHGIIQTKWVDASNITCKPGMQKFIFPLY